MGGGVFCAENFAVTSRVCILSGCDAAVYGVTLLNGELFVVRWKEADFVEVYDAASGFRFLREMFVVHMQPAASRGVSRLLSLMSYMRLASPRATSSTEVFVFSACLSFCVIRLRRMHEMLTILTDVRGVCLSVYLSVCLSVTRLKSAEARAVYAACRVRGVIRCSLCQITLVS